MIYFIMIRVLKPNIYLIPYQTEICIPITIRRFGIMNSATFSHVFRGPKRQKLGFHWNGIFVKFTLTDIDLTKQLVTVVPTGTGLCRILFHVCQSTKDRHDYQVLDPGPYISNILRRKTSFFFEEPPEAFEAPFVTTTLIRVGIVNKMFRVL